MKINQLILALFLISSLSAHCQTETRMKSREFESLQRLYAMPWYKRLKVNRDIIEGDPTLKSGAIYNYLEHVKNYPACVNPDQFAQSKARYEKIVADYNSIIDLMIQDVTKIIDVPLREIKDLKIDISNYKAKYDALQSAIPKFVRDLELELVAAEGNCHRAASVIPVDEIMDYIVIPLIDYFKNRKLEEYKLIIIRELEKLKLDSASTWDEIENFLKRYKAEPGAVINQTIEEIYRLSELDYCKLLHVPMKNCYDEVLLEAQYEKMTADIKTTIAELPLGESSERDYYNDLLKGYTEAKDALLRKCPPASSTSEEDLEVLIKALIIKNRSQGCVSIEELEEVLSY